MHKKIIHSIILLFLFVSTIYSKNIAIDKKLNPGDSSIIAIKNYSGNIILQTGELKHITVTGFMEKNVTEIILENREDKIEIRPIVPAIHLKSNNKIACNLTVTIPSYFSAHIDSTNSKVTVNDIRKNIDIVTLNGDIDINSAAESLDIQTISGSVHIKGSSEMLEGMSISGNYHIMGAHPFIKIKTSSGSITYEGDKIKNGDLYSTTGDIRVTCKRLTDSYLKIDSASGGISIGISHLEDVQFSLKSIKGKITINKNDFDDVIEEQRKIKCKKGKARSTIFIETMSSDIEIKQLQKGESHENN